MGMQMGVAVGTKVLAILLLCACANVACAAAPTRSTVKVPGTYSSLAYNAEGGDVLGYEVQLVPTNRGLKAVVQVAEGAVTGIYVVDVTQVNSAVSFAIPVDGQKPAVFKGTIDKDALRGRVTYDSGTTEDLDLKRSNSFWNR